METRKTVPILLFSLFAAPALGQTAGMLSFQGLIKDAGGNPINGAATLEFNIFSAAAGGALQAGPFGPTGVTATDGIVSTKFGPVPASVFTGASRWLEVKVNGVALSRLEMAEPPATAEQVNKPGTATPVIQVDPTTGAVGIGGAPFASAALRVDGDIFTGKLAATSTTSANSIFLQHTATTQSRTVLNIKAASTGVPAVGFGGSLAWGLEAASGGFAASVGAIDVRWTSFAASGAADMVFQLRNGFPAQEKMRLRSNGDLDARGQMEATRFADRDSLSFFLDPASATTSLNAAGDIKAAGTITSGNSITIDGIADTITSTSGKIGFGNEDLVTTGKVGIGTSTPPTNARLEVTSGVVAVGLRALNTVGDLSRRTGVLGEALGAGGVGVRGLVTSPTGTNKGIWGETLSPNGFAGYFVGPVGSANYFQRDVGIGTSAPGAPLDVVGDIRGNRFIDRDSPGFLLDPASIGTSLRIAGDIVMQPSKRIIANTALTIGGSNLNLNLGDSGADSVIVFGNDLFMGGAQDIDQNIWFSDTSSATANYIRWDNVAALNCGTNIGLVDSAFIWNIADNVNSGWSFNNATDSEFMVDELGNMNIDGTLTQGGGCDIAEAFLGADELLPPGTLVVLDPLQPEGVIASSRAYEAGIVGVVSTVPGIVMGGPTAGVYPLHEEMQGLRTMLVRSDEERAILEELEAMQLEEPEDGAVAASSARRADLLDRIAGFEAARADLVARRNELEQTIDGWTRGNIHVALIGRVPVRVVGAVRAGDHLTASRTPGVAMAQTESGPTIGIALEDYAGGGEGKVVTLIQPGWHGGAGVPVRAAAAARGTDLRRLQTENAELKQRLTEMDARLKALEDSAPKVIPSEQSSAIEGGA